MLLSGFFLKKKPPSTPLKSLYVFLKCSKASLTEKVVPVLNRDGQSSRRRLQQAWKRFGLKCIVNDYGNKTLVSY